MAELADAQDLESCGQPCRFNPCYPHHKARNLLVAGFISWGDNTWVEGKPSVSREVMRAGGGNFKKWVYEKGKF